MSTQEFTGERYIPGAGGAQMAYEHLHRYLFAARWARGKHVLDVATGSGYGAALLARGAGAVYAMDLDETAVQNASRAWSHERLNFFRGDATQLPLRSGSVALILAFEVLEHLADQEGLIREIARVCSSQGMAVISTPNKASYSDARGYKNPFHVHELCRAEFLSLLGRHFGKVSLLSQQMRAGSLITGKPTGADLCEIITDPAPAGSGPPVEPMYFLAVCSHRELSEPAPLGSAYLDLADTLLLEWKQEIGRLNDEIRALGVWGRDLESTLKQRDQTLKTVLDEVEARDRTIAALQQQMLQEIEQRDGVIRQVQSAFDERAIWAKSLEERVADRDALLKQTNDELQRAADHLARIRHHLFYRILCRLGLLPR